MADSRLQAEEEESSDSPGSDSSESDGATAAVEVQFRARVRRIAAISSLFGDAVIPRGYNPFEDVVRTLIFWLVADWSPTCTLGPILRLQVLQDSRHGFRAPIAPPPEPKPRPKTKKKLKTNKQRDRLRKVATANAGGASGATARAKNGKDSESDSSPSRQPKKVLPSLTS